MRIDYITIFNLQLSILSHHCTTLKIKTLITSTPETEVTLCVNYTSITRKTKQNTKSGMKLPELQKNKNKQPQNLQLLML